MGSKVAAPRIIPSQPGGERACHRKNQQRRIHHAYHEAGHALVGYVIGRCIEEVSIACKGEDYGGYCRFNAFIEDANNHPERRDDLGNLELITIDCGYAGHSLCVCPVRDQR